MAHGGGVRSVDATRFAMVPRSDIPRSAFDVSHGHKTTFNGAFLIPVYVDEVLPGDSFRLKMTAFCRLSTPIVPMMDNLEFESFFFFVPNRLLWDNWERFMGEQINPTDVTQFLTPYVDFVTADLGPGSLGDYMGLTLNNSVNTLRVSALPFRAYNRIWNDWFRDEDLIVKLPEATGDGPDVPLTQGYLFPSGRGKRHDYFTSARPWPEKPISSQTAFGTGPITPGQRFVAGPGSIGAPVTGIGVLPAETPSAFSPLVLRNPGYRDYAPVGAYTSGAHNLIFSAPSLAAGEQPDIRVFVNDMRTASLVQQMLERNARGGTRYSEIVRSHFGVISPDARLQRPELLGGGRSMIQVNAVAQTSASGATGTTTKLGELAAVGSAMVSGHGFSASFTEHGWILGLVNVRTYLTYQQGLNRMWSRRSPFDFYWPGLAGLGEQAIMSKEIYSDGSSGDETVFGYQERWSEYKYRPSRTSGYFRSSAPTPLDMWHLAQQFATRPVLNNLFVAESNLPIDRVLQVATNFGEQFLFDSLFDVRMVRPMPMYSIPGVGARL